MGRRPPTVGELRRESIARMRADVRAIYADQPARLREWERRIDEQARVLGVWVHPHPRPTPRRRLPTSEPRAWNIVAAAADPLDVRVRLGTAGREFSMRALREAATRQAGRAIGSERGWRVAAENLVRRARGVASAGAGAGTAFSPADALLEPQSVVVDGPAFARRAGLPNPQFGICQSIFPAGGKPAQKLPGCASPNEPQLYGTYDDQLRDIADMNAGNVRRFGNCDLYWHQLAPDATAIGAAVPKIPDIASTISFTEFEDAVLLAATLGVRLCPTLFNDGGGGALNTAGTAKDKQTIPGPFSVKYGDLSAGSPPEWQTSYMLASGAGWADWYWGEFIGDFTDATNTVENQTYQQFVLNVWAEDPTSYFAECCRRKSLAVAAFSQAVADELDMLCTSVLDPMGVPFDEVIDYVELGNELDQFFDTKAPSSDPVGAAGHAEAGKYLALLAGPIAAKLGGRGVRFRVPEIASPINPSGDTDLAYASADVERGADWLAEAVLTGMQAELDRWTEIQSAMLGGAATTDVQEWLDLCAGEAGFYWPPLISDAGDRLSLTLSDLAHQAGLHLFCCWTSTNDGAGSTRHYLSDADFVSVFATLHTHLVAPLSAAGVAVSRSLGAVAFPALSITERTPAGVLNYEGANPPFQAAMLVRRVLTALSSGYERVMAYTFLSVPVSEDGSDWDAAGYGVTGLRNDTYAAGGISCDFRADERAWARPAWHALARLSLLVTDAASITTLTSSSGQTRVCVLQARTHFGSTDRKFSYCVIGWREQDAGTDGTFTLAGVAADLGRRFSLVPAVDDATVAVSSPFASTGPPVWRWADGVATGIGAASTAVAGADVLVTLPPADPTTNPGLFCLLTNAFPSALS